MKMFGWRWDLVPWAMPFILELLIVWGEWKMLDSIDAYVDLVKRALLS